MKSVGVLAVVPARGGSKGLPGKNIRPLAGVPLIGHSILMARQCTGITRAVVSTDAPEIAAVARTFGADVIDRPGTLSEDQTPMWPVIRHALAHTEALDQREYEFVLLLDPTSPGRLPSDIDEALARLQATPAADGIIGVSQPTFNPIWHCVVERDGFMANLVDAGAAFGRRQDVPPVYRINASLYIWRAAFVRREENDWRTVGQYVMHEIPEVRAIHIDEPADFTHAELLIKEGLVHLPWLDQRKGGETR